MGSVLRWPFLAADVTQLEHLQFVMKGVVVCKIGRQVAPAPLARPFTR